MKAAVKERIEKRGCRVYVCVGVWEQGKEMYSALLGNKARKRKQYGVGGKEKWKETMCEGIKADGEAGEGREVVE